MWIFVGALAIVGGSIAFRLIHEIKRQTREIEQENERMRRLRA